MTSQSIEWVIRSLRHVSAELDVAWAVETMMSEAEPCVGDEPWKRWAALSTEELVQQVIAQPDEHPLLHSLIRQTAYIVQEYTAHPRIGEFFSL